MESKRLLSLDAFRGFTVAAMILVNNPGDWGAVYSPLLHKPWNGLSPTDLVFPFFLFIMGVSISLSLSKRKTDNDQRSLNKKIISRTLKLFAIGILLNLLPDFKFNELRYTGVLQRIALVYLVCSIIYMNTGWKKQIGISLFILIAYWLSMTLIPVEGIAVKLEPGQNLAAWIDSYLLPGKMWNGTWDPEGIFSTLPAIVTGLGGMLAGNLILTSLSMEKKLNWLFLIGVTACVIACIWNWSFPINKNLWTSSYVLLTGGLAAMTLASAIFLVDILNYKSFAMIGVVFGMNAIAIYVFSALLGMFLGGINFFGSTLNDHIMNTFNSIGFNLTLSSLLYAILCVFLNFVPAYLLYKKKVIIKL
jgi:predicted acyltransferase